MKPIQKMQRRTARQPGEPRQVQALGGRRPVVMRKLTFRHRRRSSGGFKFLEDVWIRSNVQGESFTHEFFELSASGWLLIRKGYSWNGMSGPTIDNLKSRAGSGYHDAMYQAMRLGLLGRQWRREVDRDYRDLLILGGVWGARAAWQYGMLRAFGFGSTLPSAAEREVYVWEAE